MHESPRYTNLRDYLALIRRRRWLIAGFAIAFGLLALGASLAQSPVYSAQASVTFRDVVENLPLVGGQGTPTEPANVRAARNAETLTSEPVARAVSRRLDFEVTPDQLLDAVTSRVGLTTNLVEIEAEWGDPEQAAAIANGFAEVAVGRAVRQERRRVETGIDSLKERIEGADPQDLDTVVTRQQIAQLEAVNEITDAAEVARPAEVPTAQTSPRPKRNAALGFLVGLALGLVAAFVRDSLDRRLRTARDVLEELELPVLGRISATAMGTAGMASEPLRLTQQDLESFRVLRTNLAFWSSESPPRTVLVTSGLPQEGKSTVAAALATAAAAAGQRALLVDCDLRRPALATRLGLKATPGLADYLAGHAKPQDVLQIKRLSLNGNRPPRQGSGPGAVAQDGAQSANGVSLVCVTAGGIPAAPAELLATPRCHDFVRKVGRAYDLVVIDTSPMLATVDPLQLIPAVDAVLVCVRLGSSTREEARAVHHALGRLPERMTGAVLTGISDSDEDYDYYSYGY